MSDWWRDIDYKARLEAGQKFWLDGGYDRELVDACPAAPEHDWWIFRLGDVVKHERWQNSDEHMVVCRRCYVPRCGYSDDTNPCLLPRHHPELHLYADGSTESATTWPGTTRTIPPAGLRGSVLASAGEQESDQ